MELQLAQVLAELAEQKVHFTNLQAQLEKTQLELAENRLEVASVKKTVVGGSAAHRLAEQALTQGVAIFGYTDALPTFTAAELKLRDKERIHVVKKEELPFLEKAPDLVKFVQSGLLEKTAGNGFDHQKRPLKEGEFLTIRNKWYNQDVNRWEHQIQLLHVLLRRILEGFAADSDLTPNDVHTCLKETTKIVLSKPGEPEEAISDEKLTNIKEICYAAKCMATVLEKMRVNLDLLTAYGSELAELKAVTSDIEQTQELNEEMNGMNIESSIKKEVEEWIAKKQTATMTQKAKALAAAEAAKTVKTKLPFVPPKPFPLK